MREIKDRKSMPEQFRIKETVDSDGQRVIVYEFLASTARVKKKRKGAAKSFIKVTFERGSSSSDAKGVHPGSLDREVVDSRENLGGPTRQK